jgi:hypothetical protein
LGQYWMIRITADLHVNHDHILSVPPFKHDVHSLFY